MYRDAKIPTLYHCMKRWSKKSAFKSALYILPLMTKKADQKKSAFAPSFYRSGTRVSNTFFGNNIDVVHFYNSPPKVGGVPS